jgi:eukaryotic-like serine/threonine-protein kinase
MAILTAGSTWAGHSIVRLVGAGFAEVYEVRDRSGARRALKILSAEPDITSKLQARLAQEGEAIALIEHTNVLRFYDAGVHDDRVWLLLEFVEGTTLREIEDACGGRPPLESLLRWTRQACEGLTAAHAQGVVHRDVKPENILVTPAEIVKIIDFGLAKLTGWGLKTTHQRVMGTAFYMAPEQLRSRPADGRADVYSMGHVRYEAVAGVHAISQLGGPLTMIVVCGRQLTYTPPALITIVPEVPPDLSQLIEEALAKDPALRLPTMREFADRLHEVLSRLLVHRRSAARDLPLPGREVGLQRTVPMPVHEEPAPATSAGGTVKLPAIDLAMPPASSTTPAAPAATPLSTAVSVPEVVRMTGDRPATTPAPRTSGRRVKLVLVAVVLLIAISVASAWLGLPARDERLHGRSAPARR